ncbi:MAG TPA: RHS repeat-associated core domain-containing protein, partial [Casimicrobiaceae bacterium]
GATTLSFQYNGFGQRITRWDSTANSGTIWLYDEAGRVLGEYTYPGGVAVQELIWLGNTPVAVAGAMPTSYGVGYIWTDHLSTPRAITNASGQQLWQWDSAPFGETAANGNPSGLGTLTFNHRFPGQYLDAASNLSQNGARLYDPQIGRYIQSDPIGLMGGVNPYLYVKANPISASDPSGLRFVSIGDTVDFGPNPGAPPPPDSSGWTWNDPSGYFLIIGAGAAIGGAVAGGVALAGGAVLMGDAIMGGVTLGAAVGSLFASGTAAYNYYTNQTSTNQSSTTNQSSPNTSQENSPPTDPSSGSPSQGTLSCP